MPEKFTSPAAQLADFYGLFDRLIDRLLESGRADETDFSAAYGAFRDACAQSAELPLSMLFQRLNSTPLQEFLLLAAVAPHYHKKYEMLYARLNGGRQPYPTAQLVARIMEPVWPVSFEELYESTLEHGAVRRFLLPPPPERPAISASLIPRPSLLNYLFGVFVPAAPLEGCCKLWDGALACVSVANEDKLIQAARYLDDCLSRGAEEPAALILDVPRGGGASFALSFLSHRLGVSVLALDCRELLRMSREELVRTTDEAVCHCLLWGGVLALEHFERQENEEDCAVRLSALLLGLGVWLSPVVAVGNRPELIPLPGEIEQLHLSLSAFTRREQQTFWELCCSCAKAGPGEDVDLEELSRIYSFPPADIEKIVLSAAAQAVARGLVCFDADMVKSAVRQLAKPNFMAIATPLRSCFTRADLTLTPEADQTLTEVINSAKYAKNLLEDWGYQRLLPYGSGISVLFYGPPGTGKTMAAQVLAGELGMDAYRIDLSQVVDKYIGETEKKLSRIFAAAESANAILFFDEADALFGKRTEVSDSKDKYANVETAFLLQKIEEHKGISILATNIMGNFDVAFRRRIKYLISIDMPSPEMRLKIWNSVFPPETPVDRSEFSAYAQRFELSGASIKNIAVAASGMALAERSTVTRTHLVKALRQECRKIGKLVNDSDIF